MTKADIIAKTLKEFRCPVDIGVPLASVEPDYEEVVIAALNRRLPDTDIKTCEDFRHLNVKCCEMCHECFPQYQMNLLDLPDGAKAWVCDPTQWAIYSEQHQERERNAAEGKLLRRIFPENGDK
jgi:hypothetical protein